MMRTRMSWGLRKPPRAALLGASLQAVGMFLTVGSIAPAKAAQPNASICKGKSKRFLASAKACEHDFHVKSCSRAQFLLFNKRACRSNGCRAP